ncbi:MAG: DNA primase [Chloroflexota bacterium]
MGVIDEIKQKIDIVEVISQYTTLTKAGRTFRALCPFHSEKRPSFFVYPEQQSWHCFGACSTGGDVFSFIMKKQDIDFGEALRLLADRASVTIPSRSGQAPKKDEKARLYQVNEAAAQYFHNLLLNSPAGEKARKYASGRGISLKTITDFQMGFSLDSWEALKQYLTEKGYTERELVEAGLIVVTEEGKVYDRFRNRLMFPIKDNRGQTIGFGARALDDSLPKYLNSPQTPTFDKSGSLYGINLAAAAIRQQDMAVVVEGYMDVITAHQNGFNNVVAPMGTAITDRQITILKRLSKNIALALDSDTAGEEAMLRCVEYENSLDTEVKVIILPRDKDPDDVIKEDPTKWQHFIEQALPVIDYTFNMVTARLDLTTARGKSLVADSLFPIIDGIKDEIRLDHYMTKLSQLTKTDRRRLDAAFAAYRTKKKIKRPAESPATPVRYTLLSRPEEYCLTLLLQHPELNKSNEGLLPEYFENTENREIFVTWQQSNDLPSLRARLEPAIWEHLDALINKNIPANQIEQKYTSSILRLKEEYLKGLERKKEIALALEAEAGGTAAELAKLKEQGIETSIQLGEIFAQKGRRGREQRR